MKIMVGCDNCGWQLKNELIPVINSAGHEVIDVGVANKQDRQPYYEIASQVAKAIQNGEVDRGILFCWSGMGMSIVANKFAGVYAAVCETPWAAKQARIINSANMLALGEAITTPLVAKEILQEFLATEFMQGCSDDEATWLRHADHIISRYGEKI
jgi:ribose 5-phosphate isomerase B